SATITIATAASAPANARAIIWNMTNVRSPGATAAPEHVGKGREQQRQQVAGPDHREHRAKLRLRDLEPRLYLLERETQQRAIVFIEKSRGRRDPAYPALPPGERRRPAQQSKLDTLASCFLSRSAGFGFQIRRDAGIDHLDSIDRYRQ